MKTLVGFVGLGMMGSIMADRLYGAGYSLVVHDLSPSSVERFCASHKDAVAAERNDAFGGAAVVITMLPDSNAVDQVILGNANQPGIVDVLPAGRTIIDMSSAEPYRTRVLSDQLKHRGIALLDAPVSGGVRKAADGTLAIMVGGDADRLDMYRELLSTLGKTIVHVGRAGAGHAAKALNNYVSAAGLVAICEALVAGRAFGLEPEVLNDVINSSTGHNNTTENKVRQFMLSGTFAAGFALRLMEKDLVTAVGLGAQAGAAMPLAERLLDLWSEARSALPPTADHTEVYRYLARHQLPAIQ
jgi:3-hydroxyisobutyrate dehydrogenase